jgi:hypothetical protein
MIEDTNRFKMIGGKRTMKHRETKQQFETGAQRDDAALKGRPSLISPVAEYRKAVHLEKGAEHYGDRNWEKGIPFSRCVDSAKRHLLQFMAGDESEDHLAALACNVDFLMHFEEAIKAGVLPQGLDDRSPEHAKILVGLLTRLETEAKLDQTPAGSKEDFKPDDPCFWQWRSQCLRKEHKSPTAIR